MSQPRREKRGRSRKLVVRAGFLNFTKFGVEGGREAVNEGRKSDYWVS